SSCHRGAGLSRSVIAASAANVRPCAVRSRWARSRCPVMWASLGRAEVRVKGSRRAGSGAGGTDILRVRARGADHPSPVRPSEEEPMRRTLRARLSTLAEPEAVTDLLQIAKGVIAGTTAWWLSMYILDSQLPFLAPWTALLT